jgi:hypothetical protein
LDDGGNLFGGEREHDHIGSAGRVPRLAVTVVLDFGVVRRTAIAKEGLELVDERSADVGRKRSQWLCRHCCFGVHKARSR